MKTYRLIKTYPGSPKLGTILTHEELQYCNWNEYYQEVVKKDYEILEIKGKYGAISSYIEELDNDLKDKTIFKIKRLSDGEIFTIGDKVFSEYVNYTINKICIVNDKCMVSALYDINNPNGSRLHYNLNNLKKAKQPLFTTEDGVDIFKNINKYYTPIYIVDKALNIRHCEKDFSVKPSENVKYFFNKEKAEEYILYNKPCLSLNDLKQFFPDTYIPFKKGESATEDVNTKQLEDLVKQKLNK